MIYVIIQGGLGNQLFQAALGLLVENICARQVKFLTHSYENYTYGFKYELEQNFPSLRGRVVSLESIPSSAVLIKEPLDGFDPKIFLGDMVQIIKQNDDVVLDGYWSKEAYWTECEALIRGALKPVPSDESLRRNGDLIKSMNCIGIHVRRYEYGHHGVAQMDYYRNALKEIRRIRGDLPAIVFTDEFNVCEFEFRNIPQVEVIRGNFQDPFADFFALSCCKHFILSNSSFSYWAAFIGETRDAIVYMPYPFCTFSNATILDKRAHQWHIVEGAVRKA